MSPEILGHIGRQRFGGRPLRRLQGKIIDGQRDQVFKQGGLLNQELREAHGKKNVLLEAGPIAILQPEHGAGDNRFGQGPQRAQDMVFRVQAGSPKALVRPSFIISG